MRRNIRHHFQDGQNYILQLVPCIGGRGLFALLGQISHRWLSTTVAYCKGKTVLEVLKQLDTTV